MTKRDIEIENFRAECIVELTAALGRQTYPAMRAAFEKKIVKVQHLSREKLWADLVSRAASSVQIHGLEKLAAILGDRFRLFQSSSDVSI